MSAPEVPARPKRRCSGKSASASNVNDSGFLSPVPVTHHVNLSRVAETSAEESGSATEFLSPPTKAKMESVSEANTPIISSGPPGYQYFLRAQPHRWSSTPLVGKEHFLVKSLSVPSAVSTPLGGSDFGGDSSAESDQISRIFPTRLDIGNLDDDDDRQEAKNTDSAKAGGKRYHASGSGGEVSSLATLGHGEFQKRLEEGCASGASQYQPLDQDEPQHEQHTDTFDSGIGSLISESDNSSNNTSANPTYGVQKRRSPRLKAQKGVSKVASLIYADRLSSKSKVRKDLTESCSRIPSSDKVAISESSQRSDRIKESDPSLVASTSRLLLSPPPSLEGREHVDFLVQFSERGLWSITRSVLSSLSANDLCAVSLVSTAWHAILASSAEHEECRRSYVADKRRNRENEMEEAREHAASNRSRGNGSGFLPTRSSPRLALQEVSNTKNSGSPAGKRKKNQSTAPVASPSKIRHRLFVEEAAKLSPGERLIQCPSCSSPCRVESAPILQDESINEEMERATCSSSSCARIFCPSCFSDQHLGQCRNLRSNNKVSRAGGIASKKSKTRLKRL